ncbi:MAG: hypothetical protein MUC60_02380 [Oscillatoria sp. Prado101]|nr:hypothetical protein [Oscillatoria sp. Prado101]
MNTSLESIPTGTLAISDGQRASGRAGMGHGAAGDGAAGDRARSAMALGNQSPIPNPKSKISTLT